MTTYHYTDWGTRRVNQFYQAYRVLS